MFTTRLHLAALAMLLTTAASAADFRQLTQRCEEALALSALPAAMRDRASVYVWRGDGFEKTISSDGGFHCIVQRNHPDSIIPECVTSTGEHSILAAIMVQTKMSADGMSPSEAEAASEALVASGEIPAPTGPGVNYMMSAYNYIYSENADAVRHFGPHTMFFAPGASNEVIGGSFAKAQETKGFPFVVEAGSHSYVATFTDASAESDDVVAACHGQLDL